jgi:transposase InsO family protein
VTVAAVCRQLGMSRQNYYARRQVRQAQVVDAGLITELVQAERRVQPRLGTRKLRVVLKGALDKAGVQIGRDRFFEVMRVSGLLLAPLPKEYPRTTTSDHCLPVFTNQVKDLEVRAPNEVWVSDLTYLRTEEGFLYLALMTDKFSRKIVGYHCGDTLEATGCVAALGMALKDLPEWAHPIHHSDKGSQYCCHEYVNALGLRGLRISMTVANHCAENALAERINGILKGEYGLGQKLKTNAQARQLADEGVWLYNTRRPHTALRYQTPAEVHSPMAYAQSSTAAPRNPGQPAVTPLVGYAPARRLACAPPTSGVTQPTQSKLCLMIK